MFTFIGFAVVLFAAGAVIGACVLAILFFKITEGIDAVPGAVWIALVLSILAFGYTVHEMPIHIEAEFGGL